MWGNILSAGASIIGGVMGQNSQRKAQEKALRQQNKYYYQDRKWFDKDRTIARRFQQADRAEERQWAIDDRMLDREDRVHDRQFQRSMADLGYARQKEFAKEGTGWAFDDLMESADSAGIHRLAALGGAAGAQYSAPSASGGGGSSGGSYSQFTPSSYASAAGSVPAEVAGVESYIGDVVGDAINNFASSQKNQIQQQFEEKQMEKMDAEIAQIRAATSRSVIQNVRAAQQNAPARTQEVAGGNAEQLLVPVEMPDGSVRQIPVGPDISELASGVALWGYDAGRDFMDKQLDKEKSERQKKRSKKRSKQGASRTKPEKKARRNPVGSRSRREGRK